MKYEIIAELNLKSIIDDMKEVVQTFNIFIDNLERIENKYKTKENNIENNENS